jgi:tetratricopeptide (TPR) repeat protein
MNGKIDVKKLVDEGNAKELIDLLGDKENVSVRRAAAKALEEVFKVSYLLSTDEAIDLKHPDTRVLEGRTHIRFLQFDQALVAFEAALDEGSRNADCFSYLELMYRLQGNSTKANEMQNRYSEVSPGTSLAESTRVKIEQAYYHKLGGASLDEARIHAIVLAKLHLYIKYGPPWGYPNPEWQAFFSPECQFTIIGGEIVLHMPNYYLRLRRFDQSAVTQVFQYMAKHWRSLDDTVVRDVTTILEPYAIEVQPPLSEAYKKIARSRRIESPDSH